jgi:hypothetical protein
LPTSCKAEASTPEPFADIPVCYDQFVGILIEAGWLSEQQALNRAQVEKAGAEIFVQWMKVWQDSRYR